MRHASRLKTPLEFGKCLGWTGWCLFLVSLLLPALRDGGFGAPPKTWYGWECARIVLYLLQEYILHPILAVGTPPYWSLYALSNALALGAPLLLWKVKRRKIWQFAAASYLLSALHSGWLLVEAGTSDLRIGYYLWFASFGILGIACACQSASCEAKSTQLPLSAPSTLDPEARLAAERELETYLHAASRP